jgi:hypothetical protein
VYVEYSQNSKVCLSRVTWVYFNRGHVFFILQVELLKRFGYCRILSMFYRTVKTRSYPQFWGFQSSLSVKRCFYVEIALTIQLLEETSLKKVSALVCYSYLSNKNKRVKVFFSFFFLPSFEKHLPLTGSSA